MKSFSASLAAIVIFLYGSQHLWGQASQEHDSTFAERLLVRQQLEAADLHSSDYITFGLGYSRNHYMRNFLGAIFAVSYARAFSQAIEIDVSVYYAERYPGSTAYRGSYLTSFTSDIGITAQIIPNVPLRFGIGSAFRWAASLQKDEGSPLFNLPRIYYLETLQLGINAKVEYLFPISSSINIGLRGQVQSFFTPFSTVSNTTATLPTYVYGDPLIKVINLGVFLRIGF